MPFDGSGNFTREYNWQEDRDNGIRIMAQRMDGEFDNFAGGMNQSFLRSGAIPMEGPIVMNGNALRGVANGTLLAPGLTFILDPASGFYQPGVKQIGVIINNQQKALWTEDGLDVDGTLTVNGIDIGSGGTTIGDDISAHSFRVVDGPHNYFLGKLVDGSPLINFDDGDYWWYDQAANRLSLVINGLGPMVVDQHNVFVENLQATVDVKGAVLRTQYDVDKYGYLVMQSDANLVLYYHSAAGSAPVFGINSPAGPFAVNLPITVPSLSTTGGNITSAAGVYGTYMQSSGDIKASGNILTDQAFYPSATATGGGFWIGRAGGGERLINWSPNYWIGWDVGTGKFRVVQNNSEVTAWDGSGNVTFNKNASFAGNTLFTGLVSLSGAGILPAIQIINNTVGHDYRIWAKDAPTDGLHITNESISVSYMNFRHLGDILINVNTSHNAYVWLNGSGECAGTFALTGGSAGILYNTRDSGANWQMYASGGLMHLWSSTGGDRFIFGDPQCYPVADRAYTLGWPGLRWDQVWCSQSSMQTSDAREKDWRGGLNATELEVSKLLVKEFGIYRWLADIEKDGDGAKLQCGILAQKVVEIFAAKGLDAHDYGFISHDFWEDKVHKDAEGNDVVICPAGDRYSIKFADLLAFVMVGTEQRVTFLEGYGG